MPRNRTQTVHCRRNLKIVRGAIQLIWKRIGDKTVYANLKDLVRLMDMEAEIAGWDMSPPVTEVCWVNPYRQNKPDSDPSYEEDKST